MSNAIDSAAVSGVNNAEADIKSAISGVGSDASAGTILEATQEISTATNESAFYVNSAQNAKAVMQKVIAAGNQ